MEYTNDYLVIYQVTWAGERTQTYNKIIVATDRNTALDLFMEAERDNRTPLMVGVSGGGYPLYEVVERETQTQYVSGKPVE